MDDTQFLVHLRDQIGVRFAYQGQCCTLVEILTDEASVVLRNDEASAPIQTDQYGQPNRRSRETWVIPIYSETRGSLSEELLELLAGKQNA